MKKYQIIDVFSASPYNFKGSILLCEYNVKILVK